MRAAGMIALTEARALALRVPVGQESIRHAARRALAISLGISRPVTVLISAYLISVALARLILSRFGARCMAGGWRKLPLLGSVDRLVTAWIDFFLFDTVGESHGARKN